MDDELKGKWRVPEDEKILIRENVLNIIDMDEDAALMHSSFWDQLRGLKSGGKSTLLGYLTEKRIVVEWVYEGLLGTDYKVYNIPLDSIKQVSIRLLPLLNSECVVIVTWDGKEYDLYTNKPRYWEISIREALSNLKQK